MKPALTAEEWNAPQISREDRNGNVLVVVTDPDPQPKEAGGREHAVAAIALHGAPFGFTNRDVSECRDLGQYDLAERLAALLPPTE